MTQVAMMSRLVSWYARQPELIQMTVIGRYPQEVEAEARSVILS